MSDEDLKLIKSNSETKEVNNFWNTCPRKLEYMPTEHCEMGCPEKSKDNRVIRSPKCEWWINSPEHNYCFWKFIHDKSDTDGNMERLVQSDLAKLFGWSNAKTHATLKEAMEELVIALKTHGLMGELEDIDDSFDLSNAYYDENSSDNEDY